MFYKIAVFIVNIIFRIIFRVEVFGQEKIDYNKKYILCSNHKSNFDPVTLAISIKKPIHFMAKKELFNNKILGFIFKSLNAFPVDREGNDMKALRHAVNIVKDNKLLGVFIEGSRVQGFNPDNAKPGPIMIANMAKADVLPVYIDTDYKLFEKTRVFVRDPIELNLDQIEGKRNERYNIKAVEVLDKIYNG